MAGIRYYVAPVIWLAMAVLSVVGPLYATSDRWLSKRSAEQIEEMRRAFQMRFVTWLVVFSAAWCLYGAVRTFLAGVPSWWLWLLAAGGLAAGVLTRRRAAARLGVGEYRPTPSQRRRHRRVLVLVVVGAVSSTGDSRWPNARLRRTAHSRGCWPWLSS